jgi:hypothetical protein
MLTFAVALKDKGVPVPDIAKKLTIKVGKNAGKSPLGRLALPSTRQGQSRHGGRRPATAAQARTHPPA